MKAIIFVAVLLVGYSNAKRYPVKRSATCSGLPKQLSGRLYSVVAMEAGTITSDMRFNMDLNQQRFQADLSMDGQSYSVYADLKDNKWYVVYPGGCISSDEEAVGVTSPSDVEEDLDKLSLDVSGKLGLNGPAVDLYSFSNDEASVVITLESGDPCLPVSYAANMSDSAATGSYFDLKTAVDPEKMKIPGECEHSQLYARRSLPATLHAAYLKEAMKRSFPWIVGATRKGGFPWVASATQKRGFPL